MSLTIPTTLSKSISTPKLGSSKPRTAAIICQANAPNQEDSSSSSTASQLKAFSAALALSSVIFSAPVLPASADIAGLTPCKESKQFAKREKNEIKKLEFNNYGKQGLLCGADGLPHLIVSGDQRHWGEFITPGILFLYIAGWIGWVGRSYLIAIRDEKKPTMKEIIIDVPLANSLAWRGFIWPVAAYRAFVTGELIDPNVKMVEVEGLCSVEKVLYLYM
ncbi:hypothetical protein SASPL_141989 [Salvia splendens]|uniref:Photosystem I reaction center subunit III n=1 Tax=Salvia splendens TaxID=180675 RepID=A0A8X8WKU5_SALSN|nr:hypothetical protein SASPL_141989 [Salvia splendens]